jgi:hypothetical protein
MRLFRWKHIVDIDNPADVYLSRLMLLKTPWFGIYFHVIRRPDWAHCQHDHPWPFVTCILRGGYEEEVGGQLFVRRPDTSGTAVGTSSIASPVCSVKRRGRSCSAAAIAAHGVSAR